MCRPATHLVWPNFMGSGMNHLAVREKPPGDMQWLVAVFSFLVKLCVKDSLLDGYIHVFT